MSTNQKTYKLILLESLEQTCTTFPSQWEGRTLDGLPFSVRFRWGRWVVEIDSIPVCYGETGHEFEGQCTFDDIKDWCVEKGYRIAESPIEALVFAQEEE
jgi:hypothetical protein